MRSHMRISVLESDIGVKMMTKWCDKSSSSCLDYHTLWSIGEVVHPALGVGGCHHC